MTSERVLNLLEWHDVITKVITFCDLELSKNLLININHIPLNEAAERQKYISEIKELIQTDFSPDFSDISDITNHVERTEKDGVLNLEEIITVKQFAAGSIRIKKYLKKNSDSFAVISSEHNKLHDTDNLYNTLKKSISENGELSETAYPQLAKLKSELKNSHNEIQKLLHAIIYSSANDRILQEKVFTTRSDRYVILVKSDMKGKIKGNIHDFSSSGATVFIEPDQAVPLNNRILTLKNEIDNEIIKILRQLSKSIGACAEILKDNLKIISYMIAVTALAKFSILTKSNPPRLVSDSKLKLFSARHPLLQLLIPETIVANDFELGYDYNCLIISGANTGGKTALLKTIGLCVHMAMCGIHIPAGADSIVGDFSGIMADIGDDQNISESLSTFSGQIVEFNNMLESADDKTLILLDEIMAGTNPDEGTILASAILESLADKKSKIIVATHYPGLKDLQAKDARFMNGSVYFNPDTMKPAYKLQIGLPGLSYAFEIAENYGLPLYVIEKAIKIKGDSAQSTDYLIEKIQKKEILISQISSEIELLKSDLNRKEELLSEKESALMKKISQINTAEGNKFLSELHELRKSIESRLKELNNLSQKELFNQKKELNTIIESTRGNLLNEKKLSAAENFHDVTEDNIKINNEVYILPLDKKGFIKEINFPGKRAQILFGNSIIASFKFSELMVKDSASPVKSSLQNSVKKHNSFVPVQDKQNIVTIQTSYNTIDIRGKRVDEGLQIMNSELDKMMRTGMTSVIIIHGHGTGAMKAAVRSTLMNSYYCSSFRPGEQNEGGDGVTIVQLDI